MPTYEYECKSCAHSFEVFQSMKEEALSKCPQCGKELRRVINGGTGVIFKGSGFYVTDKKGSPPKAAAEKAPAPCASCAKAESCAAGSAPEKKASGS